MEGNQADFEITLGVGLFVLLVGSIAFKWYSRAKFADRQRRYWEKWNREHGN